MDQGFGTPRGTKNQRFPVRNFENKSEKFLKFLFGGNWALLKSPKKHFPMVMVIHFRSFSSFVFEIWALLKSFKNDFPMVSVIISRSFSSVFLRFGPSYNHPKIIFRWSGSHFSEVSQVFFVRFGPS